MEFINSNQLLDAAFTKFKKPTHSLNNEQKGFLKDVIEGLTRHPKQLPCKYFYDEKGSALFEEICQLDEYYITRTELQLLENIKYELAEYIGKQAVIIEPGAGAGLKIQKLLAALEEPLMYVPTDISRDFLFYSASIIQDKFPTIEVFPIQGDFTQPINWLAKKSQQKRVVFFPGSTLGNFEPKLAVDFLTNMRDLVGCKGGIILGIDLLKDEQRLIRAYDDKQGITAEFNKNLLNRINQDLNGNFKLRQFSHLAKFNQEKSRIEMHLVSKKEQHIQIAGHQFSFTKNETIHTENSHKYSDQMIQEIAAKAGLKRVKSWVDEQQLIAIYYLTPL